MMPTKHGSKSEHPRVTLVKPNLSGDWLNFFLLLLLYTLQGMPLGLIRAIPIILQSKKNVTYENQALYIIVMWPYTLKLLWAPLVDAFYIQKIGRRKSWLVPVQFAIGACFFYIAYNIDELLPETKKPNILNLVYVFFTVIFMAATQDIVVDGWALTMLKKNNVGHSSTCNTTGLAIGMMISYVSCVLFTSENFCNKYLRVVPDVDGVVTMKSLFYVWGFVYIFITVLIAMLKKEDDFTSEDEYEKLNIIQNYSLLWNILKLPGIQILAIALLTVQIGFATTEHVTPLKLIDAGVSKDDITVLNTAIIVIKMVIPLVVANYTSGTKSMSIYINFTLIRLFWNIPVVTLIYYTPRFIKNNGSTNYISIDYYAILTLVISIEEILSYIVFVAMLSLFSRISDPHFGGTYMTLLNTLSNLGIAWSSFTTLNMVDFLTFKTCSFNLSNNCSTIDLQNTCKINGGECITMNGYYAEMILCTILGLVWYFVFRNILKNLQIKYPAPWLVKNDK